MIYLSSIQVSEGSVTEPVSLSDAKAWLQIDFTDHDALLTSMITGARKTIENFLNLALVEKDVTLDLEITGDCEKVVNLPYTRELSDVVIDELDNEDVTTPLISAEDYFLRGSTVRITPGRYSISYTTVPGVSEDLREAIKMEVAERYSARGENLSTTGLSEAAKEKAAPHKIIWL